MTNTIERRINLAAKAASLSNSRFQVGCAVFKGSRFIRSSCNHMNKSDAGASKFYDFPFPHAEYKAVKNLDTSNDYILYVARLTKDGNHAMAKPCDSCMKMLSESGVKAVFYTTENGIEKLVINE